jgi:hypothetical protein
MRKLIANEWMTLDGVVQAPSYADEDVTGGFGHGGWHTRYFDELSMNWVIENVLGAGGYLLGRGGYEIFASHWPNPPEEQQLLAEPVNTLSGAFAVTLVMSGSRAGLSCVWAARCLGAGCFIIDVKPEARRCSALWSVVGTAAGLTSAPVSALIVTTAERRTAVAELRRDLRHSAGDPRTCSPRWPSEAGSPAMSRCTPSPKHEANAHTGP